jgi:hypothetical protein
MSKRPDDGSMEWSRTKAWHTLTSAVRNGELAAQGPRLGNVSEADRTAYAIDFSGYSSALLLCQLKNSLRPRR